MPNYSRLPFRHCAEWPESPRDSTAYPALALPKAPPSPYRVIPGSAGCGSSVFAQEAEGQADHSTLLQTLVWAGMGTGGVSSQLEQLAQSGSSAPCAGGTACPSPGLEGVLSSLTVSSGLRSFALCQQLVAMMALFVILFFRKESELIPKGLCLSYSPRLQMRLELLFHILLHADYLLFSLSLSLWSGCTSFCILSFCFPDYDLKPEFSKASTKWFTNNLPGAVWHLCELCRVSANKGKGLPCSLFKASV